MEMIRISAQKTKNRISNFSMQSAYESMQMMRSKSSIQISEEQVEEIVVEDTDVDKKEDKSRDFEVEDSTAFDETRTYTLTTQLLNDGRPHVAFNGQQQQINQPIPPIYPQVSKAIPHNSIPQNSNISTKPTISSALFKLHKPSLAPICKDVRIKIHVEEDQESVLEKQALPTNAIKMKGNTEAWSATKSTTDVLTVPSKHGSQSQHKNSLNTDSLSILPISDSFSTTLTPATTDQGGKISDESNTTGATATLDSITKKRAKLQFNISLYSNSLRDQSMIDYMM
jgi:uncharacterized protein (DUF1778 family)